MPCFQGFPVSKCAKFFIQTRKVWFDVGYFNVAIYTVLY